MKSVKLLNNDVHPELQTELDSPAHDCDRNGEQEDTEDSGEENRSGKYKTSGNQIFFDVQIGVSPPNSPKQPPPNESKGLPNLVSPKQIEPGTHSKLNGCFSWKKGKRLILQYTKSKRVHNH
ncbi:hypothetical protein MKX03_008055 [Papaver bracteatum]|nr:hypothetical protein MKX03_008055 [Papaver bracteatum]